MNSFRRIFWLCGVTLLGVSLSGWSQEQQPLELGGFQTQGSATFGYRFTDVKGRVQKYNELFNLQQGPRLMDFSLFGRANEGAGRFADRWSLDLSGMGGDPFPTARLTVSKEKVYDLTVSFRKDHYYWDRNDNVIVPNAATGTAAPGYALTNNHDWATTRQFASVDLTIHATRNLRFGFQFQRNTREGLTFTTNSLDFFGSPSSWGAFSRDNAYYLEAPVNEFMNRVTGSIDYTLREWNFHYRLGYQAFEQNYSADCLVFDVSTGIYEPCSVTLPTRSIDINIPTTASELVNSISIQSFRRLTTPVSEFSYDGKVGSRLSLRGGYIFYRYQGPATYNAAFNGTNRVFPTSAGGYNVTENDQAQLSQPNHVIDQGFTVKLTDWVSFSTDYRYQRFTEEEQGIRHSVLNVSGTSADTADNAWRVGTHILTSSFEIIPVNSLIIRAGVRFMKNDIVVLEEDEADEARTKQIKSVSPMITVYYRPSKVFSVRGDFQSINNGASYVRLSPHIDKSGRFVFRVQPTSKLAIEDSLFIRNRNLLDPSCETIFVSNCFENNSRTNATNISYSFNDKFALFAGFSYDSYFATDSIHFQRGAAPGDVFWRDQFINRVWQGGLSIKAPKYAGANFSGNFVRTTGFSQITGEPVRSGPLIWPMITGTFWFEVPRAGRLSLDLQRTYYAEEIMQQGYSPLTPSSLTPIHANDFSANLLTIRWTKDF
jgi:hypothetical protein